MLGAVAPGRLDPAVVAATTTTAAAFVWGPAASSRPAPTSNGGGRSSSRSLDSALQRTGLRVSRGWAAPSVRPGGFWIGDNPRTYLVGWLTFNHPGWFDSGKLNLERRKENNNEGVGGGPSGLHVKSPPLPPVPYFLLLEL